MAIVALIALVGLCAAAEITRRVMRHRRLLRQEVESLQQQVIRQERLAAIGQLVSGVAHEINNPLQAIIGFAELMQMQDDVPATMKADLKLIHKEGTRASNIIRNIAVFTRQTPETMALVHVGDVIGAVCELQQRRLDAADIELSVDDRARQPVSAVFAELQQVLLNLVVNAEHAIQRTGARSGTIAIRSRDVDGRVLLEVEDTGAGLPAGDEARLFEPFFTTKPAGEGTGLGLSISRRIVESQGGRIGYRRGAAGAIFYCEFPAVSVEAV